jgi:hypothetical protein
MELGGAWVAVSLPHHQFVTAVDNLEELWQVSACQARSLRMPSTLTVIAVVTDQPLATVNQPPETHSTHAHCTSRDCRELYEGIRVLGIEQRRL